MFFYLSVFAISTFFVALAEQGLKRRKSLFYCFSAIAILVPSLAAGFRDLGVGTDTLGYCQGVWNETQRIGNLFTLLKMYNNDYFPEVERIYLILNWFVSLFSSDIHALLFALNFIVLLIAYLAAYDNKDKADMWQVFLFFLLCFYNNSLNLMRQTIAITIGLYALKFFEKKQWAKLAIAVAIMLMFHNTSFVFVGFIFLNLILKLKNKYIHFAIISAIVFAVYSLFLNFDDILLYILNMGIVPSRFSGYLSEYSDDTFLESSSIAVAGFVVLFWLYLFIVQKERNEMKNYIMCKVVGTFLHATSLISKFAFRMSYFFSVITDCLYIPRTLYLIKQKSKNKYIFFSSLLIGIFILLWINLYVNNGINQTIPYKSSILGIK